ncbi:helix-turn-helix domain-containing protein [Deferrisoma palaeochoriense]
MTPRVRHSGTWFRPTGVPHCFPPTTGYDKKRTAELLGISRPPLDRKIRDYGIDLTGRRRG